MKSTDILTALGDVSERYKTEAEEENADKIFKKSEKKGAGLRVFKFVLSGAALLGLCAFAIFIGVAKNHDNIAASMLERGADIPHEFSKFEVEKTSYTKDAKEEDKVQVEIPVCDITPAGLDDVDPKSADYFMLGSTMILDVNDIMWSEEGLQEKENGKVKVTYERHLFNVDWQFYSDCKKLGGGLFLFGGAKYRRMQEEYEFSTFAIMYNGDGTERWCTKHKDPVGTAAELILQAYLEGGKIYVVTAAMEDLFTKSESYTDESPSYISDYMLRELIITVYDEQTGEILSRKSAATELRTTTYNIHCIGKTEYGFIISVLLKDQLYDPYYILLDYDGNITSVSRFGTKYEFCSASSINGQIYLSGKYMPDDKNMYPHTDHKLMKYEAQLYRHQFSSVSKSSNAYEKYKNETKAVLMVCDANMTPVKAYTQSGSYGGSVRVENGSLLWDACEITSAYSYGENSNVAVLIAPSKTFIINEKGALESRIDSDNVYAMEGYKMDKSDIK